MKFYLLDRVTSVDLGKSATGLKAITYSDEILHDHFPDYPIFPGSLMVEGLAQLGGFLLEVSINKDPAQIKRALIVQIEKFKFLDFSIPGDVLTYEAKIESLLPDAAKVSVMSTNGGKLKGKGQLMFSLQKIDSENVNKQRRDAYKIWTRGLEQQLILI